MLLSLRRSCTCVLAGAVTIGQCASSWSFADAMVSVQSKGAGAGNEAFKEKLLDQKALSKPVTFGPSDILKIILTAREDGKPKKPHQAFLSIKETASDLEISVPLSVKDNGKGKVEVTAKELPAQLTSSKTPLRASLILASFGTSQGLNRHIFDLELQQDAQVAPVIVKSPVRYGKLDEIHHIFREDPKSPAKIITLVFTAAVIIAPVILFGTWLSLGANINHLSNALSSAPISHSLFFGSLVTLEGIFFLYYTSWNLFQVLPAVTAVGSIAFFSGSRALSEVQERRLAGLR